MCREGGSEVVVCDFGGDLASYGLDEKGDGGGADVY